ncbi:MAG: radical SAM protein, partial [bacterium]|nr:radical SAM protein [bacterium]
MEKKDCLFIGHNEMDFNVYERNVRKMGTQSGAYRDLELNYLQYNNKLYTASEIFNLFFCQDPTSQTAIESLKLQETFSAAIAYLGSYLHKRNFSFDYVNSFQDEKEELARKLSGDNYNAIAIITTLYVSALPIIEIVDFIRKYNKTAKIIIGGPFISTQFRTQSDVSMEYLFKNTINADVYVNSAQGEATLAKVLDALKNSRPLDDIDNIYFKKENDYVRTSTVVENNPLAENMVDWSLFSAKLGEYANLRTAISCPFACAFCGFPQHAGKYQMAGVDEIEKELIQLDSLKKVKYVHFIDDTFNVPQERFKDILRMMIRNKFAFKWYSHYRCQFADEETIRL